MNTFKKYLLESAKKYEFRVKIAGDISEDMGTRLESALNKWKVSSFKKVGKTPVQEFPLDFPQLKNEEVSIYTVTVDYPTTQNELTEYLSSNLGRTNEELVVRSPYEPSEEYQQTPDGKRTGALLDDPNYSESPNANWDDHWGQKHNESLIKSLSADSKKRRAELGEKIPAGETQAVMDSNQYSKAPITQAPDPRRK